MISCSNLTRQWGQRKAVDSISFDLPQGSVCALLGPNGAGKSTTVSLLTGVLAPTSGSATVAGLPVRIDLISGFAPPKPGGFRAGVG
jgi:ABC-2 type transport system ATP-binding protein